MTYIIAEIGQNHNGEINLARRLIDAAHSAGANAVKFQKRTLPDAVPVDQRDTIRTGTPWGDLTYLEYRKRLEFEWGQLASLKQYAEKKGLQCFVSVWDTRAAEELDCVPGWPYVKVPSAKITDLPLLKAVKATDLPVIISTGMSTIEEISNAARVFRQSELTIMHCHSAYPAATRELNLRCVPMLMDLYPWASIGYSGHEWGISTTTWAVVLGATVVERHITLDRGMFGSDQLSSLEPDVFAKLVKQIRSVPAALGNGVKRVWESEEAKRKSLRG